jgi:hypothetical protein
MTTDKNTFEVMGMKAVASDKRAEIFLGDDHVATLTFRPSGIYTVAERGRGSAGRLPAHLQSDVQGAVEFVLKSFWQKAA